MTLSAVSASARGLVLRIYGFLPARLTRRRKDFNCAFQESAAWEERASEAVAMLRRYLSPHQERAVKLVIGDFGAGNERLRGILEGELPGAHEYHAFDLAPQLPTTTRIDLRTETPVRHFDVVFCLGVLEYFHDPAELLSRIASVSHLVVFSYVVVDGAEVLSRRQRRARGWLSDLSVAGMDRELGRIGLDSRAVTLVNRDRTSLWLVESASDRPIDDG